MNKSVLLYGGILFFVFATIAPAAFLLTGVAELNREIFFIWLNTASGTLITLGLPFIWLARQREVTQQPVFARKRNRLVLVAATIVTTLLSAGMFNPNLSALPLILMFPIGLVAFFTRSGFFFSTFLAPVFGWLTYLGVSIAIVFNRNRQTARVLYIALVLLLITNIGGCARLLSSEMGVEGW